MFWIAVAAHLLLYVALGAAIVRLGRRHLPSPFNEAVVVIPTTVAVGLLLILATLPHWHLFEQTFG